MSDFAPTTPAPGVTSAPWHERAAKPAFAAALAFSATLLFTLQPMFTKMATPLLGGSPSVWNTALVFFQAVLLLGYLYAHALTRFLTPRRQVIVHAATLLLGAVVLPIAVSGAVGNPPQGAPVLWLMALFALSVGPAFFAISASAPLLQAWYARTGRPDSDDPYHLYAASNVGSLGALIGYPIVVEPVLSLAGQSGAWTAGYFLLAGMLVFCGGLALRLGGNARTLSSAALAGETVETETPREAWRRRGLWTLYAAVPSSLLIGTTTHITTDVASAPFLWVAPLALFLLTFIIAFGRKPAITAKDALTYQGVAAAAAVLVMTRPGFSWGVELAIHLTAFFLTALVCHFELVRRRPPAARLTEFYFFMSLGGVIGGALTALVAPLVFQTVLEYPLVFLLALALRPVNDPLPRPMALIALAGAASLLLLSVLTVSGLALDTRVIWLFLGAAAVAAAPVRRNRLAFVGLATATFIAGSATAPLAGASHTARGFFGVHRVVEEDGYRLLAHGTTVHGVQSLDPAMAETPMSYYGPLTPIGQALRALGEAGRLGEVAAVGLGAGSIACYAAEGERWTFYEIDPLVRDIAADPEHFSFLSRCAPEADIVMGDARLTLAEETDGRRFTALVLDAFSSDVVPTHLMTREALALYFDRLAEGGIIIAHISNRAMALEGPLADLVADAGGAALVQVFVTPAGTPRQENEASHVMLIARASEDLALFRDDARWRPAQRAHARLWTDDFVNVPGAMLSHALNPPALPPRAR